MTYFSLNSVRNQNFPFSFVPGAFPSHTMQSLPISRDSLGEHFCEENEKKIFLEKPSPPNGQIINSYHTPTLTTLARCCRHADWPSARPSTIPVRSSRDQTRASCKTLRNWISPKITVHGSSQNQHRIVDFWHFQFHHHHRTQSWEWQLLNQQNKTPFPPKRGFAEISLFCGQFDCLTSCDFYFRSLSNFGAIQICYQISIRNAPGRSRSGREGRKDPLFPSDEAEKIESENWNLWLWESRPQKAFCRTGPLGTWPQRDFYSPVAGSRFLHLFGDGKYMNIYYSCRCHSCVWFPGLLMRVICCVFNVMFFF